MVVTFWDGYQKVKSIYTLRILYKQKIMYRRIFTILHLVLVMGFFSFSLHAQKVGVKTNLVYWATTTPNAGIEFALGKKTTFELTGGLNLFEFPKMPKLKHWLLQPELRFWTCEVFNRHFFGIHLLGGQFNVCGRDLFKKLKGNRYQGYGYGGGLSYGYHWILSPRWNFEFSVGAGYARLHYDQYPCIRCSSKIGEGIKNYWGLTKASLSVVYLIK